MAYSESQEAAVSPSSAHFTTWQGHKEQLLDFSDKFQIRKKKPLKQTIKTNEQKKTNPHQIN